jgi:cell division septation protein DedD
VPIPAVPGLGEPRKVRTVAIRPDGTPAPTNATTSSAPGQGIVTGSAPSNRPASATPAQTAQAAQRPQQPSATPAAAPKTQERAAAPATPPAAQTPPANTRTAALAPQQTEPAATAPRADPNGGFAVQLGAPGSEAEARATFAALQRKYPGQLNGQSPIVRKTELAGGKTVYRLRVGPYSREDASSMCSALQAAGGQCFIAKN